MRTPFIIAGCLLWLGGAGCGAADDVEDPAEGVCREEADVHGSAHTTDTRWDPSSRTLTSTATTSNAGQRRVQVFRRTLDDRDRVVLNEELSGGRPVWRHVYELDAQGNATSLTYEFEGSVVWVEKYQNRYEGGRLVSVDANGGPLRRRWTTQYDGEGRRTKLSMDDLADGTTETESVNTYTAAGDLDTVASRHLHGELSVYTFFHDPPGRLRRQTIDGGPYLGDADGDPEATRTWSYDAEGRLRRFEEKGTTSDIDHEKGIVARFSPACEALRPRFPSLLRLPSMK